MGEEQIRREYPAEVERYALDHLPGAKMRSSGTEVDFKCLLHEDNSASGTIFVENGRVVCHAGCHSGLWLDEYAAAANNLPEPPQKFSESGRNGKPTYGRKKRTPKLRPDNPKGVSETYHYPLEDGSDHILVDRVSKTKADGTPGKEFFPSSYFRGDDSHRAGFYYGRTRPDGSKAKPILYRLPRLVKLSPGGTVVVVEGEKDVHTAEGLGLVATTNPSGAKNVDKVDWSTLAGHHVVIIPDNDEAGEDRVDRLVPILANVGVATLRIVRLPGVPDKGGDLTDWVNLGGTRDQIVTLIKNTHPVDLEEIDKEVDSPEARLRLELTKDLNLMKARLVEGLESRPKQFLQKPTGFSSSKTRTAPTSQTRPLFVWSSQPSSTGAHGKLGAETNTGNRRIQRRSWCPR